MYSTVVMGLHHDRFEIVLDHFKEEKGYTFDTQLRADDWRVIVAKYKEIVAADSPKAFPQDPREQLWGAIGAVFSSWINHRAIVYRQLHHIPENWGTAVNVQAMVFGNIDDSSATGVAFTRNPSTGARELYGEFLVNAQGEDVVAGIRTPQSITEASRRVSTSEKPSLEALMPNIFQEFKGYSDFWETSSSPSRGPRSRAMRTSPCCTPTGR